MLTKVPRLLSLLADIFTVLLLHNPGQFTGTARHLVENNFVHSDRRVSFKKKHACLIGLWDRVNFRVTGTDDAD
ncbi:MAG: hypothetical protein A4E19_03260 [Nitrospira sp. SG-bin1]|nr:MAG: hypothetical protein A4E19_03260 [Nitrospira sp. SG-bin1]